MKIMLEQRLEAYISRQPAQEGQRVYTVVDLECLSASALYTGEPCGGRPLRVRNVSSSSVLGEDSTISDFRRMLDRICPPIETIKLPEVPIAELPTYSTPSRLFLDNQEESSPALRFDPAEGKKDHETGHLHTPAGRVSGLSTEEACSIYAEAYLRNVLGQEREKQRGLLTYAAELAKRLREADN